MLHFILAEYISGHLVFSEFRILKYCGEESTEYSLD